MPRGGTDPVRRRARPQYREAAQAALELLDWCITYLHRINKPAIAERLRENRRTITKRYDL
jgi:hypothetical protein